MSDDQRPCDTEEPSANIRHAHCDLRQRIERFYDAKVIDIDVMRRRRDLAAAVGKNWSPNPTEPA
jgi:hypothetical protein